MPETTKESGPLTAEDRVDRLDDDTVKKLLVRVVDLLEGVGLPTIRRQPLVVENQLSALRSVVHELNCYSLFDTDRDD